MAGSGTAHLRERPEDALLRVENLVVEYDAHGGRSKVQAVSNISFDVSRGESLGLVGESGCGKSTTGRAAMMLARPTSGRVVFDGVDLGSLRRRELRALRSRFQMIFQDPMSSLNARRRISDIVREGLEIHRDVTPNYPDSDAALASVGLEPRQVGARRPGELSGGQCQRVAIARALMVRPSMIICDEPVSALDVSVQAQILNLLQDMREQHELAMIFIAHDLAVVRNISDRIAVMYMGKLCEVGPANDVCDSPRHPYTQVLLSAVPSPDPDVQPVPLKIAGDLPSPLNPPSGCRFSTRCPLADARCAAEEPLIRAVGDGHFAACHHAGEAL